MPDFWFSEDNVYYGWTSTEGVEHIEFREERALALMLSDETLMVNSYWWKYKDFTTSEKDENGNWKTWVLPDARWTEEESEMISVSVICNDIFAWGCADAEDLPYHEIENLYKLWKSDKVWGSAKWCAIRRNQKPQGPVIKAMKEAGAWDTVMENLGENTMQEEVTAYFKAMIPYIKQFKD